MKCVNLHCIDLKDMLTYLTVKWFVRVSNLNGDNWLTITEEDNLCKDR